MTSGVVGEMTFLQRTIGNRATVGLPDHLRSGVEQLSGYSMDDVSVHYDSDKPAQISAHAYTQGSDIFIGRGQEEYLPHEAWHVVQQKQGRVAATRQLKSNRLPVNNEKALEHEADVMGAKSLAGPSADIGLGGQDLKSVSASSEVVQGAFIVDIVQLTGEVEQVDLEKVESVAALEKLVWLMPDDELNDGGVRDFVAALFLALQQKEAQSLGSKVLALGSAAKEAPKTIFEEASNSIKGLLGVGISGTEEERASIKDTSGLKGAKAQQFGRDMGKTGSDVVAGQMISQGAELVLGDSVPGLSMLVAAARSGQMLFRGHSAESPGGVSVPSVIKPSREGYEEIPDGDIMSGDIKKAIQTLASAMKVRAGGTLGSAATGTAVGAGIGAALTAPIGAVPGAIVGAIIGSIAGLIASTGFEKGTRDLAAERKAVKTLVDAIIASNRLRGQAIKPRGSKTTDYGTTHSTSTVSSEKSVKSKKSDRASRHQGGSGPLQESYQNSPSPDMTKIDGFAAYSALLNLGVTEGSLRSLSNLEQSVLTELKIT